MIIIVFIYVKIKYVPFRDNMVNTYAPCLNKSEHEEYVKQKKKINRALNTFNHRCGKKKNSYIRYNLRHIGCSVPGCGLCGKTPKSKFKSKGEVKKKKIDLKFTIGTFGTKCLCESDFFATQ
ncbi:putative ORFan [Tupanvirus deep ocean]|uniref:ORFan n=2 Tax=Tupanvirus TaxID=2094720 RepID=A0AC62A7F9_9VIRU|nr:putative ORFan [Tupanvirus deep ocean]QKU33543.1 putative ORFan [Tupanvirus deep ocean]